MEGFADAALLLEARKRSQKVLEKAYEAGKATEEDVLDRVIALGDAYMWMDDVGCHACYKRAKEGFAHLLREDSAKAVEAAFSVASKIVSVDKMIAELRRLWR